MAQNRKSQTGLASPARLLGGGAVALVHLAFFTALLLTDRLTLHKIPDGKPMHLYRLPDETPAYNSPAIHPITPPSVAAAAPSSVLAPRLDGPLILIQPEKSLPPNLRGLDLSVAPITGPRTVTQEDLLPSKEARLKQFFKESQQTALYDREPSAGEDCKSGLTKDSAAASLGESAFKDPVPMITECKARPSAKAETRRNDRFAPQ